MFKSEERKEEAHVTCSPREGVSDRKKKKAALSSMRRALQRG